MAIFDSSDMEELWSGMVSAAKLMKLDYLELNLESNGTTSHTSNRYSWHSGKGKVDPSLLDLNQTMYTSLPLENGTHRFGALVLAKHRNPSSQDSNHILRRIEHLRRTVKDTLIKLADKPS